jgi:hypothetical protein
MTGPSPTDAREYADAVLADTAELLNGVAQLSASAALRRFEAVDARLRAALAEKDRT